jgi:hypothetical protein
MTKQKYDIGQDNGNKEDDDDEEEDDEYVVGPLLAERASDKEDSDHTARTYKRSIETCIRILVTRRKQ